MTTHITTHITAQPIYGTVYYLEGKDARLYIGQTITSYHQRCRKHMSDLHRGKHCNAFLQAAYDESGRSAFVSGSLYHATDTEDLNTNELRYIAHYRSTERSHGYNVRSGGGGHGGGGPREFMSYTDAQTCVHEAGIRTQTQFYQWARPDGIPSNPNQSYRKEWSGWKVFLGTDTVPTGQIKFVSYDAASTAARAAGIRTQTQFRRCSRPDGIPSNPDQYYIHDWRGWGNFLGTGTVHGGQIKFVSYDAASTLAREAGIRTRKQFKQWSRPSGIPSNPDRSYRKDWSTWGVFCGMGTVHTRQIKFVSYDAASTLAREAGIRTQRQYYQWQKPIGIPSTPNQSYKREWSNWKTFLGTNHPSPKKSE